MKIGDVKVGERYAAHDEPTRASYSVGYDNRFPREVEVLEVVTVEEQNYSQSWAMGQGRVTRKVRRVKVKVIGGTPTTGYYAKTLAKAKPDETIVIEAKFLVALWKDLRSDIAKAIDASEKREALFDSLVERLAALGLKESSASVGSGMRPSLSIYGADVEKLLSLAESGKAWSDLGDVYRKVSPGVPS